MIDRCSVLVCALAMLASACSGERSEDFESQTLTRVSAGEAGECENGALVIESGLDTNKDGVLGDDEVLDEDTQVICQGEAILQGGEVRRVDPIEEGDERCPDGGILISVGKDDDKDMTLDDGEVDSTEVVCNSERPHAVLTKAIELPVGHEECRYGGRRIDAGLDDGAGEGNADDNELAEAEVDTSYYDCNATAPTPVDVITPPEGEPGSAVINLSGGSASAGTAGGYGGNLINSVRDASQCTAATTRFFPTGEVDASYTVPTLPIDLGDEPLVVSADRTIDYLGDVPVVGEFYYRPLEFGGEIVRWTSGTPDYPVPITGLRVQAGAKLTVPVGANLYLPNDVEILGSLFTPETSDANGLLLSADVVVLGSEGRIELPNLNSSTGLEINGARALSLQGTVVARGGTAGAPGANVKFQSVGRLYLGGKVDISGADGDVGGAGGTLRAFARTGGVWSSASVNATGGAGQSAGGTGGTIFFGTEPNEALSNVIDVRNSGALNVSGGAQASCPATASCPGGAGGSIALTAVAAGLHSTGQLKADGGASEQSAGAGGQIILNVFTSDNTEAVDTALAVTGNLLARGGAGSTATGRGGNGGSVSFVNCTGSGSSADFLGYADIVLTGGSANDDIGTAGTGGGMYIGTSQPASEARRLYLYVPVHAQGGDGYGAGGGGVLSLLLQPTLEGRGLPVEIPSLVVASDVLLDGGESGERGGGYAGTARLVALGSVHLTGSVSASAGFNGGDALPAGGTIEVLSTGGAALVTGDASADGSTSAQYDGGQGGCVGVEGRTVSISGALSAQGGNGNPDSDSGSRGGDGGTISYTSHDAPAEVTGTLDVAGGTGTAIDGKDGKALPDLPSCSKAG